MRRDAAIGTRRICGVPLGLAVLPMLLALGCATMITGTKDQVHIVTVPAGATVELQGQVAQTPATLTLSRSLFGTQQGRAVLSGYQDATFEIPREFNLWALGNVVTLGLGAGVDVLTGAFLKYPEQHQILLRKEE